MMRHPDTGARELKVVYVLHRSGNRRAFLQLMSELRSVTQELLGQVGANPCDYTLTEQAEREGWFTEIIRFACDQHHSRFDDLYSSDRRTTAIQSLLDDLVDGARSDYILTRRQSRGCEPVVRRSRMLADEVPLRRGDPLVALETGRLVGAAHR
jgi:hypothetical protein